ncbi:MAG: uncharacterized protein JWL77_7002 [Chthonomonadaceae bacterium]|nr:uncharacterized protein [Chthonomonadaceae bacterium]
MMLADINNRNGKDEKVEEQAKENRQMNVDIEAKYDSDEDNQGGRRQYGIVTRAQSTPSRIAQERMDRQYAEVVEREERNKRLSEVISRRRGTPTRTTTSTSSTSRRSNNRGGARNAQSRTMQQNEGYADYTGSGEGEDPTPMTTHNENDNIAIDETIASTITIPPRPPMDRIANHPPLLRHVPFFLRSRFRRESSKYFNIYLAASRDGDTQKMTDAIAQLLLIPSYMLARMRGGKRMRKKQMHLHRIIASETYLNRMSQKEAVKATEALITEAKEKETFMNLNIDHIQTILSTEEEDKENVASIKKSVALVRTNHIGRATKALVQTHERKRKKEDEERISEFAAMHPQDKGINAQTVMPPNSYTTTIDLNDKQESTAFDRFIHRLNNGSAPGTSGWTGDMLVCLLGNKVCRHGLAKLICDMMNGTLPEEAKQYLLPSHLIGIPKPNDKIRPISMGEVFYRAAALYGINSVIEEVGTILAPIQFGVGIQAGCEQAVHQLQHLLTRVNPIREAGIAVDFKNAFNERKRDQILEALYKEKKLIPLWKLTEWAYSSSSPLWIRSNETGKMIQLPTLMSTSGVKQGDPLGSLLFALSMKQMYNDAVSSDNTGQIKAIAFQDDITLVGPPDQRLITAVETLRDKAEQGGLEMNMSKTKMLWLHSDIKAEVGEEEEIREQLNSLGIEIEEGGTKLLGACIGTDVPKLQSLAINLVEQHRSFFDCLLSPHMPVQECMLLLRMCGLPRFNYLSRTTLPHILQPAAVLFDQFINRILAEKFQIPFDI